MKYDASSFDDLQKMADAIALIPTEAQLVEFLSETIATGIMVFEGVPVGSTLNEDMIKSILMLPNQNGDLFYVFMRTEVINHLLYGTDRTPESLAAGGWNQNELDQAAGILERIQKC
jgi:hypothetical protein